MDKHIMIDIETFGPAPDGCLIEVGVVAFSFNDEEGQTYEDYFHEFISPGNAQDCGMKVNADTVLWWQDQGGWNPEKKTMYDLDSSLYALTARFDWNRYEGVWTNAPLFDLAIMRHAYKICGIKAPWSYRQERDCRTLFYTANKIYKRTRPHHSTMVEFPVRPAGTKHNALEDARYQVKVAQYLMGVIMGEE